MRVGIPTPLRSYTAQQPYVSAQGPTLDALLRDLDRQFPGIRFRMVDEQDGMRPHIVFFVNGSKVFDLRHPLDEGDEVFILQALSGG
jgi:molybdopterin converting factor small subunit